MRHLELGSRSQWTSALLALGTGWVALFGWQGLVEASPRFLGPTLLGGALVAVVGVLLRARSVAWYAVLSAQLLVVAVFVNHLVGGAQAWLGWIPNQASLQHTVTDLRAGADALSTQYSPVPAEFPGVHATLALSALAFLVLIDVLACGLRRVPLAGLPLLVIWMIPISLLRAGLPWPVFVLTALLFCLLLATEETGRVLSWGRAFEVRGEGGRDSLTPALSGSTTRAMAVRIGLVATAAALVVPLFVPLADATLFSGTGPGPGDGPGRSVNIINPLVDLRRDLVRGDRTPLLRVRTDDPDPSYVRLTVLDQFTGASWRPSSRDLPASNRADGEMPPVPGLQGGTPGSTYDWSLSLLPDFHTAWLPTPYPLRSLHTDRGDWRYDERTLDIADARGEAFEGGLDYSAVGFVPDIHALSLEDAFLPPSAVREEMTELPDDLPDVVGRLAQQVTDGKATNYQKALALQDWFRSTGGFRYSLDRAPGSGMQQLAAFVTDDKVGYCEQFAAAMATMARTLDIPARVAVGFLRPTEVGDEEYVYTSDDLHAWPELYFTGIGWVRFEPTPAARTGDAPSWTTEVLPTASASAGSPAAEETAPRDVPSRAPQTGDEAAATGTGHGSTLLLVGVGVLVLVLLLLTPRLVRDARRRSRLQVDARQTNLTVAEELWAELRDTALDLGIPWAGSRSVRHVAGKLNARLRPRPDVTAGLEELVAFIERARYARPFERDPELVGRLHETVREWSRLMAGSVTTGRERRARWWPASVVSARQLGRGVRRSPREDRPADHLVGT